MDKTDKSITEVSSKVFSSCFSFLNLNISVVYLWPDILSVWLGTHFRPWIQLPSRNQLFGGCKILMLSPVTLEKVTTFLLRGDRTFSETKNMWIICVATISSEICLSYLGKVFGNLDVVFVNSTGNSCWPKTNLTFFNFSLLIQGTIFVPLKFTAKTKPN